LPLNIDVGVLYSNKELLDKYNEKPPKTWDELIRIASIIKDKEKKVNEDIIIFTPVFTYDEMAICTAIEFLYSFRDTVESGMPDYTSDNCIRALDKIKEIKEKISSDEEFRYVESELMTSLFGGKNLFTMFFYVSPLSFQYYISPVPGEKEGISASCIGGQSIIINKYISEEKKIAAGKIIDFLLSEDYQKKGVINNGKQSAMKEIYYDDELCSVVDCTLFRNLQLVSRPIYLLNDYTKYSLKFRKYLYNYLYNNATAEDTLQKIDDIATIDYINYYSTTGIITITITIMIIIIIILSSLGIIFNQKNQFYFTMFNKSSWFIMLLGLCILICYNFTLLGQLNIYKCIFHRLTPIFGLSLFSYPILIHELINFPDPNKYSEFVKNKYKLIITGLIVMDFIYGALIYFLTSYQIKVIYVEEGKNYNKCINEKNINYILLIIMYVFKCIMFLSIAILTFIEYNLAHLHNEMKTISIFLYVNTIFFIIIIGVNFFNLGQFYVKYIIKILIISTFTLINYIIIIWVRMYYEKSKSENVHGVKIIKKKVANTPGMSSTNVNIISKIINYHYFCSSMSIYDKSNYSNVSMEPEINLYTSVIPSCQMTDISNS